MITLSQPNILFRQNNYLSDVKRLGALVRGCFMYYIIAFLSVDVMTFREIVLTLA